MTKHQKLFSMVTASLIVAGCGMGPQTAAPQASAPAATGAAAESMAALPQDASVVNQEAGFSVQQYGGDMYNNDGRVRLAMRDDDGRRMRYDYDDRRLRVLRPRFESLLFHPNRFLISPFHRQHPIFINVHRQRVFRLNPAAFVILTRVFPDISPVELQYLVPRLVLVRNFNVLHPRFPVFIHPFARRHVIHRGRY